MSTWRLKRLIDSFADAIAEQSKESGLTGNRSRSLLAYCVSPFATMCMLTAMVLNRIVIFASSRRVKQLPRVSRTVLRLVAIYLLFQGSVGILVSLRLYSSSDWLNYLLPSPYFDFVASSFKDRHFLGLYYSPTYFQKTTAQYTFQGPTTAVLKPFYLSLCLSQILETFVAVTSGTKPSVETSLTLFEYSLAFQEVQGYNLRPPVELLEVALIALANQLCIHLLGLFNLNSYRLIPSTAIGIYTLGFCFSLVLQGHLFMVPFSVIMGYLPHIISFTIICASFAIYLVAGIARGSFKDLTVTTVINNLSAMNISLADDFYSALLVVGSFVINASGRQSYVVEAQPVRLPETNYLEQQLKSSGYGIEVPVYREMVTASSGTAAELTSKDWIVSKRLRGTKKLAKDFAGAIVGLFKGTNEKEISTNRPEASVADDRHIVESNQLTVDIDRFSNDEIEEKYPELLLGKYLADTDESPDYQEAPTEDESDETDIAETDISFNELIDPEEFQTLLRPCNAEQIADNRILGYHMKNLDIPATMLTRSNFAKYYDEDLKLLDLIREKNAINLERHSTERPDREVSSDEEPLGTCVICHVNSRQIILWPCKCLAICDSCRVSLFVRKFNTCVCCRSKVESYSKVYVP
ncbi:DEKNAAC103746 [Brettanomyces naardenensis]|uniref:DEKNAAC103746 n=1 Tax=Brettanomyces naardenensis TaxID=13370 RepID=A0A448YPA5_BRENA|nr:DEKNAAC103746 [Brettanomyces naardenensis]